jgi:transcriptional regulator with XRE-family HTH domain
MPIRLNPADKFAFGKAFRLARMEAGFSQAELAQRFAIAQPVVSRWERGVDLPPAEAVRELGRQISPDSRKELLIAAGLTEDPEVLLQVKSETRKIPLLLNSNELGTPDADMDYALSLPSEWLPQDANVKAARFETNISPLFSGELIALVDTRYRDPDRLSGCIVAARTPNGVEPMSLRRDGSTFFLVPLRLDGDHAVRVLHSEGDWSIIGKILKWIGDAPQGRKS